MVCFSVIQRGRQQAVGEAAKKPAAHAAGRLSELVKGDVVAGFFLQKPGPDEGDSVLETFGKLLEILLVEEDLVLVVGEGSVPLLAALAFGNGQIEVVVAFCSLHIEEIGTLAGADRLRVDVFGVSLLGIRPFKIFTVHGLVLLHFFYKCREII